MTISIAPPLSPALTMVTYRSSNQSGWAASASARDDPSTTAWRTSPTTTAKRRFSVNCSRMARLRSTGRPASSSVASWAVKKTTERCRRQRNPAAARPPAPSSAGLISRG